MKQLFNYIGEGLLDIDALDAGADQLMADKWAQDNLKGNYTLRRLKDGTFKVKGNVILRKYQGKFLGGFSISALDGSLYVEDCPDLESLDGLFAKDYFDKVTTKVTGDIKITNCKSFNSLKGIPNWIDGEFACIDCPSLKSLEDAPTLATDIILIKNGKKFSQNQIKTHFKSAVSIMCSQEEYEEYENMICEAMSEPHLIKFWDWLKNTHSKLQKKLDQRLSGGEDKWWIPEKVPKLELGQLTNTRWDQIRPSDVEVYDNTKDKVKDIRKKLAQVVDGNMVAIVKNLWDGEPDNYRYFIYSTGGAAHCANLDTWQRREDLGRFPIEDLGKMATCDIAGTASGKPNGHLEFIFINIHDYIESRYKIRNARNKSREGMVYNTPEYYKEVARENRKRYKAIIASARARNVSKEYANVVTQLEPLIMRFARVPMKLTQTANAEDYSFRGKAEACSKAISTATELAGDMMKAIYSATGEIAPGWAEPSSHLNDAKRYKEKLISKIQEIKDLLSALKV